MGKLKNTKTLNEMLKLLMTLRSDFAKILNANFESDTLKMYGDSKLNYSDECMGCDINIPFRAELINFRQVFQSIKTPKDTIKELGKEILKEAKKEVRENALQGESSASEDEDVDPYAFLMSIQEESD